jgi:hypothetical protein
MMSSHDKPDLTWLTFTLGGCLGTYLYRGTAKVGPRPLVGTHVEVHSVAVSY